MDNRIYIAEHAMPPGRFATGALLHEYVHSRQDQAEERDVQQSDRALEHTDIDEINREYEAFVIAGLFNGESLAPQVANTPSTQARPGELAERTGGGSRLEMREVAIPREVLSYALDHAPSERATRLDQLPRLSYEYRRQLARNAPAILYPAEWRRDNTLILRTLSGAHVDLGRFDRTSLEVGLAVKQAFWASATASAEQHNYRHGFIVVYRGSSTIAQISVGSSAPSTGERQEGAPLQERTIPPLHP